LPRPSLGAAFLCSVRRPVHHVRPHGRRRQLFGLTSAERAALSDKAGILNTGSLFETPMVHRSSDSQQWGRFLKPGTN